MEPMDEAVKAHFDNGAYVSFSKIDKFNGGILEVPENIISKRESNKFVYEVDDEGVIIYINGIKDKTVPCPAYATRPLVALDILFRMIQAGYSPRLLKVTKDNEELLLDEMIQTKTSADLLDEPDRKNKRLEEKLYKAIDEFFDTDQTPTSNIKEGFDIICKHYFGELNANIKQA